MARDGPPPLSRRDFQKALQEGGIAPVRAMPGVDADTAVKDSRESSLPPPCPAVRPATPGISWLVITRWSQG
jgi:hypothetical protein